MEKITCHNQLDFVQSMQGRFNIHNAVIIIQLIDE